VEELKFKKGTMLRKGRNSAKEIIKSIHFRGKSEQKQIQTVIFPALPYCPKLKR
jgi:hypothetical protein